MRRKKKEIRNNQKRDEFYIKSNNKIIINQLFSLFSLSLFPFYSSNLFHFFWLNMFLMLSDLIIQRSVTIKKQKDEEKNSIWN